MKQIVFSILFIFSLQAHADESREFCKMFGDLAGVIMEHRQAGTPMDEMIDWVDSHKILNNWGEDIVIAAYGISRYSTEEYQQKEISEFRNTFYLACIKDAKKK